MPRVKARLREHAILLNRAIRTCGVFELVRTKHLRIVCHSDQTPHVPAVLAAFVQLADAQRLHFRVADGRVCCFFSYDALWVDVSASFGDVAVLQTRITPLASVAESLLRLGQER